MEKNYLQLAYWHAGDLEYDDLISLISNLYERLDKLGDLEVDESELPDHCFVSK